MKITGGSPVFAMVILPNLGVMLKTKYSSQLPQFCCFVLADNFFLQHSGISDFST